MIGKVIIGKSFYGCIAYCLEDKKTRIKRQGEEEKSSDMKRATVLSYNLCYGDKKALAKQFTEVARLRQRLGRSVLHITLSFAPGEWLEKEGLIKVVDACAKSMGFDKNQYLSVIHRDTKHQHVHIVANRVGFDGGVVTDSNNYKKMAQFCRQMEEEAGLRKVLSPRRFLPPGMQDVPRKDHRKQALQNDIQLALAGAKNMAEFRAAMTSRGYRIEQGRGIAFTDAKGVRTKGSEVGYSLKFLEKIVTEKSLDHGPKSDASTTTQTAGPDQKIPLPNNQKEVKTNPVTLRPTIPETEANNEGVVPKELRQKKEKRRKPNR